MVTPLRGQLPSYVPTNGLVGWYSFNGNANDESGNGNNATYIGSGVTLTSGHDGVSNSAYNFDGISGSYIRIPADDFPVADRTISLWFNVPTVSNKPELMGYGGDGNCGTSFFMGLNISNQASYQCSGHCDMNTINYPYPAEPVNIWKNYVISIQGESLKLYVDGELKQSANNFLSDTYVIGKDLVFGTITYVDGIAPYTDFNTDYLHGKLDNIGIWNRELSQCEINQLYYETLYNSFSNITISSCESYTSPSGNYTWTVSGVYSDTISNTAGCDSIITINLTINTVDISLTVDPPVITANAANAGFQWIYCDSISINGAIGQSYTATQTGQYAVIVTQNGCVDTSECVTIIIDEAKILFQDQIILYPNPSTGLVSITLNKKYENAELTLYNNSGQEENKWSFSSVNFLRLNLEGKQGYYVLKLISENGVVYKKLLLVK